jgi:hypothetical protein
MIKPAKKQRTAHASIRMHSIMQDVPRHPEMETAAEATGKK